MNVQSNDAPDCQPACVNGEVVDELQIFNAPMVADGIDRLLGLYRADRTQIEAVAAVMNNQAYQAVMHFFAKGNTDTDRHISQPVNVKFGLAGAVAALNSHYWDLALKETDVLDAMPQARRNEWAEMIRDLKSPDFEQDAVRSTLRDLLNNRKKFFAERVDGVFRKLSKSHLTNRPEGFSKRLIIEGVIDCWGHPNSEKSGYINDLRCVIARLSGRTEPCHSATGPVLKVLQKHYGQWMPVDAGIIRMKLFKKGTVHIEISPDMAWGLNEVLATLYPLAIPSEFRTKPKKPAKEFELLGKPLSFAALIVLGRMRRSQNIGSSRKTDCEFTYQFEGSAIGGGPGKPEACMALEAIGGVRKNQNAYYWYEFDYDPQAVIDHVVTTGCIPDHVSHQFYPTQDALGARAVEMAGIEEGDEVLEPQAGQGGLAKHLPTERTTCVEVSKLHCEILQAKGYRTVNADFLKWAETAPQFDKIVCNPPFSKGRAEAHLVAASKLVKATGVMVAILPGSLKGKAILGDGWSYEWSALLTDQFEGTGVTVVLLKAKPVVH